MSPAPPSARRRQAARTRAALLDVAERLFAERGLAQVSNRQVAEEAGQANNSAVAYHVGTKADLVQALCERIIGPLEAMAAQRVAAAEASGRASARDYVSAFVLPYTAHLASLGHPSWSARFVAQVVSDPVYGVAALSWETFAAAHPRWTSVIWADSPALPPELIAVRSHMMQVVVLHTCAEREAKAAAAGVPVDWDTVGEAIVDAVMGMLLAPVGAAPRAHAGPAAHQPAGPLVSLPGRS